MTTTTTPVEPEPTRRLTLQWGYRLGLGAVLAPLMPVAGCGASGGTADTLPEPEMLAALNGVLDLSLRVQYANQTLQVAPVRTPSYPGPAQSVRTSLRSFNGRQVAPTLVLSQGDKLRLRIDNRLPPNVAGQSALAYLNHQNSTNLHFHGLHVDPKEIRPGVFGDYVVDSAQAGVLPGGSRQHELLIPGDHPAGVNWYHPHLHGASNVQVSSGMFGAILIRDPANTFAPPPDIRERVMFVHKVSLDAAGKTETFYDSLLADPSAFLLNGAYQPTLTMRPGEVQNWHFINSAVFFPFDPVLDGHTLNAYARDGNPFDGLYKPFTLANSTDFSNQRWPGNAIYPGGRHSVIVKASDTPGTYFLRAAQARFSPPFDEIVARIVVEGEPARMAIPSPSTLPRYRDHAPITDAELAAGGGKQRNLILAIVDKADPLLALPVPPGEDWFIPLGDGADSAANTVFASGTNSPSAKLSPFQSALTTTQTVALNAVEEWTISNANNYPHPFHIHINDSYVVKVNGEVVTPFWADTLPVPPKGNITFRMRFTDFTGKFVWHCHALDHEDLGMMQLVEIV